MVKSAFTIFFSFIIILSVDAQQNTRIGAAANKYKSDNFFGPEFVLNLNASEKFRIGPGVIVLFNSDSSFTYAPVYLNFGFHPDKKKKLLLHMSPGYIIFNRVDEIGGIKLETKGSFYLAVGATVYVGKIFYSTVQYTRPQFQTKINGKREFSNWNTFQISVGLNFISNNKI